jgi:hypothetical protein
MNKVVQFTLLTLLMSLMTGCCLSFLPTDHGHHQQADVAIEVRNDPVGQTLTVLLGPLNLPPRTPHTQLSDLFLKIPFDGWLTAYHPRLVDENGTVLPSKLLHHLNFYNIARSDFLCSNNEEFIFAAGSEMASWPALAGVGYRVEPGTPIRIMSMFHNPTPTHYQKVYLEVNVAYELISRRPPLQNVYPVWFYVGQCGLHFYHLKPGKNVDDGWGVFDFAGRLLGVGGHLHDYGLQLRLENIARKETIAVLDSALDSEGRFLSLPVISFTKDGGYRLNRGNVIKITAIYDNPTGKLLSYGAMGMIVGYFLPDEDKQFAVFKRATPPSR